MSAYPDCLDLPQGRGRSLAGELQNVERGCEVHWGARRRRPTHYRRRLQHGPSGVGTGVARRAPQLDHRVLQNSTRHLQVWGDEFQPGLLRDGGPDGDVSGQNSHSGGRGTKGACAGAGGLHTAANVAQDAMRSQTSGFAARANHWAIAATIWMGQGEGQDKGGVRSLSKWRQR